MNGALILVILACRRPPSRVTDELRLIQCSIARGQLGQELQPETIALTIANYGCDA
jgi:hypothetical protein